MHKKFRTVAVASATAMFAFGLAAEIGSQAFAQVGNIVVTARKREETTFDIPLSVSAYSQTAVDAFGVNTVGDLSEFVPGFAFQDVGQGGFGGRQNGNIRFRGVAVQNENPASRAGAVFWDGTYISSGAGILPLIDLERVEVIRGPQNAFYGRNTFAGAVNFIPRTAGDEFNASASVNMSPSQNTSTTVKAAIGGPVTDGIGIRIAGIYEEVGADYEYTNGDPLGEEETHAITGAVTWDVSESFRLKATGFYVGSEDTRTLSSQNFTTPAGACNLMYSGDLRNVATGEISGSFTTDLSMSTRGTFCGNVPDWDDVPFNVSPVGELDPATAPLGFFAGIFPTNSIAYVQSTPAELEGLGVPDAPDRLGVNYELWRAHVSGEWDLPGDHLLSFGVARGESASRDVRDNNFGELDTLNLIGNIFWVQDDYVEVRVSSGDEQRIRYQFGLSYYDTEVRNGAANFLAEAFGRPFDLSLIDGENIGVFGSIDWDILDNLTLSAEGRWNKDTQTIVYDGNAGMMDPNAVIGEEQSFSKFMPRVLMSYRPVENINLYASWATSYLQGNDTNAADYAEDVPGAGLNPETVGFFTPVQKLMSVEVGLKHQVDDWLSYSIAGYYMDWENQVIFELSPAPIFTAIYQPGDSRYYGVELEASADVVEWLNVTSNVSYTDAEFTDFAGTGSVASAVLRPGIMAGTQISSIGLRPRYIPQWTAAVSATVQVDEMVNLPVPAYVRMDAVYTGQFFIDNFEYNSVEGYWKANIRAGVEVSDNVSLELYATNLTDNLSWQPAGGTTTAGGGRKTFGLIPPRREFGFQVNLNM